MSDTDSETEMVASRPPREKPPLLLASQAAAKDKDNQSFLRFNLLMLKLGWVACLTSKGRKEHGMTGYPTFKSMFAPWTVSDPNPWGDELLASLRSISQSLLGKTISVDRAERYLNGTRLGQIMVDRNQDMEVDFQKHRTNTSCSSNQEDGGGPLSMDPGALAELGTVYSKHGGIVSVNLALRYAVDRLLAQRNAPKKPAGMSFQEWMHTELYHRLKEHHFLKARAALGFEDPKKPAKGAAYADSGGEEICIALLCWKEQDLLLCFLHCCAVACAALLASRCLCVY